ncbi:hypothetical protein FisN_16Lh258 [Fistulifera solaris]|uniref:Uncharacterized protein n=1 Tax=Fistulifera solaris TaxID=1519565 RepID=A0A1Z5J6D8_FISSO|nr:hypothetical protein FisN_16Lh258 [Fistulifera solaris]|eukprot:GAX09563.1 hypothetical protein FisN_16Lh258 [Fistulifera solaris]
MSRHRNKSKKKQSQSTTEKDVSPQDETTEMTLESSTPEVVAPHAMKSIDPSAVTDDVDEETILAKDTTKVDETKVIHPIKAEDSIDAVVSAVPVISSEAGNEIENELMTSDAVVTKPMSGFQELEQLPSGEIPLAELHLQPPILDATSLNEITKNKEPAESFMQESLPSVSVEPDLVMTESDMGTEKVDVLASNAFPEERMNVAKSLEIQDPATTSKQATIDAPLNESLSHKDSGLGEKIDVLATEESDTEDYGEEVNNISEKKIDDIVTLLSEKPLINKMDNAVNVESAVKEKDSSVEEVIDIVEHQIESPVTTMSHDRDYVKDGEPFRTPDAPSDLYEHVGDVDVTGESTKQEQVVVALLGDSKIADVQDDWNVKELENETPIKSNNQEMILASNKESEIVTVELQGASQINKQETETPMSANDYLVTVENDKRATVDLQETLNVDMPETEIPKESTEQAEILLSSEEGELRTVELQEDSNVDVSETEMPTAAREQGELLMPSDKVEKAKVNVDIPETEMPTKSTEQAEILVSSEEGELATVELQKDSNVDVPETEMSTAASEHAEVMILSEKVELQEDAQDITQENEAPVIADHPEEKGEEVVAHNSTAEGGKVDEQTIKSNESVSAGQANQNKAITGIDPVASPIQENDARNVYNEMITHDSIDERGNKDHASPINEELIVSSPETETAKQTPKASPRDPPTEELLTNPDSAEERAEILVNRSIDPPETSLRELEDRRGTGSSTAHSRLPFVGDVGMAEQFDADISAVLLETEARDSKILDASESIMAEAWSDVEPWNDDVDIGPGYIKPASTAPGPMLTSIFVKRNTSTRPGLSEVPSDEVIVESMSMDTLTVSVAEFPVSEPSSTKGQVDVVKNSPDSGTATPGNEAGHEEAIQSTEPLQENHLDGAQAESSNNEDLKRTLNTSQWTTGDSPDAPEDELIVAKEPDPEEEELSAENNEQSKSVVSEMTPNTYRLDLKDPEDAPDDEVMAIKNEEASGNPLISSALSPSTQRTLEDPLLERSRSADSKVLSPRREAYNDKAIISPNKSYDEKRKPDPSGAILSSNYPTRPTTPPPQPVSPQSQATLDNQAQDAAASGCGACLIL